jgi:hypothetical protein
MPPEASRPLHYRGPTGERVGRSQAPAATAKSDGALERPQRRVDELERFENALGGMARTASQSTYGGPGVLPLQRWVCGDGKHATKKLPGRYSLAHNQVVTFGIPGNSGCQR